MRGLSGLIIAALALAGCAREADQGFPYVRPSQLGVTPAEAETTANANAATANPAVRHVTSNKVLGAMAFQKVTGRTVDPDRLNGGN